MNKEEVKTILKGLKKEGKELHITLSTKRFYNGTVLSIDEEDNCLRFNDMRFGYSIIPFSLINGIELYREKE